MRTKLAIDKTMFGAGAEWCPQCGGGGRVSFQDPGIPQFQIVTRCDCIQRYVAFGEDLFDAEEEEVSEDNLVDQYGWN